MISPLGSRCPYPVYVSCRGRCSEGYYALRFHCRWHLAAVTPRWYETYLFLIWSRSLRDGGPGGIEHWILHARNDKVSLSVCLKNLTKSMVLGGRKMRTSRKVRKRADKDY